MSNSYLSEVKCVRCRELENEEEEEDLGVINKVRGEWSIQTDTVLRALHHIGRVVATGLSVGLGLAVRCGRQAS